MRRFPFLVLVSLLIPVLAEGQAPHRIAIRAGKLIDGKSDKLIENAVILIEATKSRRRHRAGALPRARK